jgi:hypothetical protein
MADEIENYVEENYEKLVTDGRRTYESIAKFADEAKDKALAAWARRRHAETGGDTTPKKATRPPRQTREAGGPAPEPSEPTGDAESGGDTTTESGDGSREA